MRIIPLKKTILFTTLFLAAGLTGCSGSLPASSPDTAQEEAPPLTEEEQAAMRREETLVPLLEEAEGLALGYYYEEAIACLEQAPEEFAQDEEVTAALSRYEEARDAFVPYDQPVRHIFFHSLIVDTSLAFDGDYMENGYNYWMTTIDEFKAMLEQLYAKSPGDDWAIAGL